MENKLIVYGIPNCDTVQKSIAWLVDNGVAYTFHDFKKQGVPEAGLAQWIQALGWEALINKKGTTWRKLDAAAQAAVTDAASAVALMLANPSVIRRPVVVRNDQVSVGFAPERWI
jgi:arsenate reductase (glutaredoxin)